MSGILGLGLTILPQSRSVLCCLQPWDGGSISLPSLGPHFSFSSTKQGVHSYPQNEIFKLSTSVVPEPFCLAFTISCFCGLALGPVPGTSAGIHPGVGLRCKLSPPWSIERWSLSRTSLTTSLSIQKVKQRPFAPGKGGRQQCQSREMPWPFLGQRKGKGQKKKKIKDKNAHKESHSLSLLKILPFCTRNLDSRYRRFHFNPSLNQYC